MANNYDINYDDQRFTQVETDKSAALSELENTYAGMIGEADKHYQAQIDASKQWADKQSQLQQEQTDFAVEKIEQQKEQANKDYTKEQSGAYVDWQKQSNRYGAEAERQATVGMSGTGFSESSQVSMYNTYQNRVASARESYNNAVLNYNNAIKDARLQNNAALAEIANQALQTQLELTLNGFQYKNNLLLEQANKKTEIENNYYNRYLAVLDQINKENALAEEIRQYNEQMEWEKYQFNFKNKLGEFAETGGGSGGSSGGYRKSSGGSGGSGSGNSGTIPKTQDSGDLPEETAKSILALGQGPLSASSVAQQVASGNVVQTTSKNGNTVFKQNAPTNVTMNYLASGVSRIPQQKEEKKEEKSWRNLWGLLD